MPQQSTPRIVPVPPDDWSEAVLDALGAFPKSRDFVLSSLREGNPCPRGLNVLGTLAHHPELAKAVLTFNAHVSGASKLPVRTRELVILRISWLQFAEYEFGQHDILGRRAGLTPLEINRIQEGPEADGWSADDRDLLRATDDLHRRARIGNATWARLSAKFSTPEILDLVFLVGCYQSLGAAFNTFETQPEPETPRLDLHQRNRMGIPAPD